eukprot:GHVU01042935.1.p1 GENE.GHVU01042935.1~~GHVU01042935.1.p1  ORF type:complete len:185 (+),score=31.92 GHVU01042935.1:72-557(+)
MEEDSKWFHGMLCRVRDTAENGGYQPLPMHVYDMHDTVEGGGCGGAQIHAACGGEAQDARGATPSASSEAEGRSGKTYVICGGFGGICLVVAEWLVHEGATDIALLSQSGGPSKAAGLRACKNAREAMSSYREPERRRKAEAGTLVLHRKSFPWVVERCRK